MARHPKQSRTRRAVARAWKRLPAPLRALLARSGRAVWRPHHGPFMVYGTATLVVMVWVVWTIAPVVI